MVRLNVYVRLLEYSNFCDFVEFYCLVLVMFFFLELKDVNKSMNRLC